MRPSADIAPNAGGNFSRCLDRDQSRFPPLSVCLDFQNSIRSIPMSDVVMLAPRRQPRTMRRADIHLQGATEMNLTIWLPSLFALGVLSIAACWAFAEGCARI
jgi:hypothetical protein